MKQAPGNMRNKTLIISGLLLVGVFFLVGSEESGGVLNLATDGLQEKAEFEGPPDDDLGSEGDFFDGSEDSEVSNADFEVDPSADDFGYADAEELIDSASGYDPTPSAGAFGPSDYGASPDGDDNADGITQNESEPQKWGTRNADGSYSVAPPSDDNAGAGDTGAGDAGPGY